MGSFGADCQKRFSSQVFLIFDHLKEKIGKP